MTALQNPEKSSRVRASERAVTIALKALKSAGLSVDKLCIAGGQIEIHCGGVEPKTPTEEDDGLEPW